MNEAKSIDFAFFNKKDYLIDLKYVVAIVCQKP